MMRKKAVSILKDEKILQQNMDPSIESVIESIIENARQLKVVSNSDGLNGLETLQDVQQQLIGRLLSFDRDTLFLFEHKIAYINELLLSFVDNLKVRQGLIKQEVSAGKKTKSALQALKAAYGRDHTNMRIDATY